MANKHSKKELEIYILYFKGLSQKEIVQQTGYSKSTVAEHIRTLRLDAGLSLNPERRTNYEANKRTRDIKEKKHKNKNKGVQKTV